MRTKPAGPQAKPHLCSGGRLPQHTLLLRQLAPEGGGLGGARAVLPLRRRQRLLGLPQPLLQGGKLLLGHCQVTFLPRQLSLQFGHLQGALQRGTGQELDTMH